MIHISRFQKFILVIVGLVYLYTVYFYSGTNMTNVYRLSNSGTVNNSSPYLTKWIIVGPGKRLAFNLTPGWHVLEVGNTESSTMKRILNYTFLGPEDRINLPFKLLKRIPKDSHAQKTIGYLYAIARGAEIIYETDVNPTIDKLSAFNLQPKTHGLLFTGAKLFNPHKHFGQPMLYARGFPMDKITETGSTYYVGSFITPYIQHGLVDSEIDTGVLFRSAIKSRRFDLNFDSAAPSVILSKSVLSPFNSQNTLFLYDAFWALVRPVSVNGFVSDILRGFWAQRLLWEIDGSFGFIHPNGFDKHTFTLDLEHSKGEVDMKFQISSLVEFLQSWNCPGELSFFECVIKLSEDMAHLQYWGISDLRLIEDWLYDLNNIGYIEPIRQKYSPGQVENPTSSLPAIFHAAEQNLPKIQNSNSKSLSKWNQVLGITSFCASTTFHLSKSGLTTEQFRGILLIIVFNFPIYDNIPYLQLMYGVQFTHILYCGNDMNSFLKSARTIRDKVSFVEVDVFRGYFAYRCLSAAMKMKYIVDGYLMIGDDTLLNSWHLPSFSLHKIWYTERGNLYRDKPDGWHWWNSKFGRPVFNQAWDELKTMAQNGHELKSTIEKFMETLKINTGSNMGLFHAPSDILYIPSIYASNTVFFMDIFSKYNVFLEVAIPTVIAGLQNLKNVLHLKGQYLWYDGKRNQIPQLFKADDVYLHPVKLSMINTTLKTFFCETYFPLVLFGSSKYQHIDNGKNKTR